MDFPRYPGSSQSNLYAPKKRQKPERVLTRIKVYAKEFCGSISVAGFRYLVEKGRPNYEKVFWTLSLLLSMIMFAFFFSKTWGRYKASPVIIAMDETQREVWQIPFPAVTICPQTKSRATLFNVSDAAMRYRENKTTPAELAILQDLSFVCSGLDSWVEEGREIYSKSLINNIEKYGVETNETVYVMGKGNIIPGCRILNEKHKAYAECLQPIMTEEGLCLSFNMLPGYSLFSNNTFHRAQKYLDYPAEVKWDPENGYRLPGSVYDYPLRVVSAGVDAGFSFVLSEKAANLDFLCSESVQGFKVVLHSPTEFPSPKQLSFFVPLNSLMQVSVSPSELITDHSMETRFTVKERNCYFPRERRLAFFQMYSRTNCRLECVSNFTLRVCGCVSFYMPRHVDTPVCALAKKQCILDAREAIQLHEAGFKKIPSVPVCGCLQSCSHVKYNSERSALYYRFEKLAGNTMYGKIYVGATLNIFFKRVQHIPMRRIELFDIYELIAQCGGILGLCLGISVLSIAELLYWCVVRPFSANTPVFPERIDANLPTQVQSFSKFQMYLD